MRCAKTGLALPAWQVELRAQLGWRGKTVHRTVANGTSKRAVCITQHPSSPVSILQKIKQTPNGICFILVRKTGLEPVRCEPHAPQTCASACSATSAFRGVPSERIIVYYISNRLSSGNFKNLRKFRKKFFLLCGDSVLHRFDRAKYRVE